MQYKVVHWIGHDISDGMEKFESEIEELCEEGWKPQGGISISTSDSGWYDLCQAMVK